MQKNKATLAIAVIAGAVIIGLFLYPRLRKPSGLTAGNVPCLVPNVPLIQHIHPHIVIEVEGIEETIPANVGLGACERAIHTHDTSGEIHVEAQDQREYILANFFQVWGRTITRDGYNLEAAIDGQTMDDPEKLKNIMLKDEQNIVLRYKTR